MFAALAPALASLATAILQWYWTRKDQTDAARWRVAQEMEGPRLAAEAWRVEAEADPVRAAILAVRPGARGLTINDETRPPSDMPSK